MEKELQRVKTYDLVKELKKREGVTVRYAEPHDDVHVDVNGPATILIVID